MTESADDHLHTVDDVVAVLQSPARADELQGEAEVVAAMAAAILADAPKELPPVTRSRPLKIAVIAGAAVLSLAGVAAATGALPNRAPSRPPASTSATSAAAAGAANQLDLSTTSTSTTSAPALDTASAAETASSALDGTAAAAAAGAQAAAVKAPPCPADVKNHGDYVSRVARDTPPGPDHGAIVAAAAQSDCGKDKGANEPSGPPASAASTGQGNGRPHPGNGPPDRRGSSNSANGNGNGHGRP